MMNRFAAVLLVLLLLTSAALAESLPAEGPAPYAAVASALSEDGLSYDDGTLSFRIEKDIAFGTNIYYVYVTITDPSQLRTALPAPYPSKKQVKASTMAQKNNAVLALNGDFFNYHSQGYVVREGKVLRTKPRQSRDTLIIDGNGDFHIITNSSDASIKAFEGEIREAFCFGPGLIVDGEVLTFKYAEKVSCGYPTKAQRMIYCQLGPLEYMFLATEGPEQDQPGLSVPECMTLLEDKHVLQAYNMDGGNSTSVVVLGSKINARGSIERNIGDIVYFATLVPDNGTAQ